MKYEKPIKGNPRKFTIDQHRIPARSIARFAGPDGRVDVQIAGQTELRRLRPTDARFSTRRTWDQRTENFTKTIEDKFQKLADRIVEGELAEIPEDEAQTVNRFYALWYQRSRCAHPEEPFIQMKGITGSDLTKEQQEILESQGINYVRPGGTMPARFITGMQLQLRTGRYAHEISGVRWGIVRALEGEFLVPDITWHSIMPIAPTVALVASTPNGSITRENLRQINIALFAVSSQYLFARDLRAACAGISWDEITAFGERFEAANAAA